MITFKNQTILMKNLIKNKDSIVDSDKIVSEFTRKDIEKSYNIDTIKDTEAYYSSRYGWTLRKALS